MSEQGEDGDDLGDEDVEGELATCAICGLPLAPEELEGGPPPYYCDACAGDGLDELELG